MVLFVKWKMNEERLVVITALIFSFTTLSCQHVAYHPVLASQSPLFFPVEQTVIFSFYFLAVFISLKAGMGNFSESFCSLGIYMLYTHCIEYQDKIWQPGITFLQPVRLWLKLWTNSFYILIKTWLGCQGPDEIGTWSGLLHGLRQVFTTLLSLWVFGMLRKSSGCLGVELVTRCWEVPRQGSCYCTRSCFQTDAICRYKGFLHQRHGGRPGVVFCLRKRCCLFSVLD